MKYFANDTDILQVGKVMAFKNGKCIYVIQFTTRAEYEKDAYTDFDAIIGSAVLKC